METKQRYEIIPPFGFDVNLSIDTPAEGWPAVTTVTLNHRGAIPYYEKAIAQPKGTGRSTWKDFQHFKSEEVPQGKRSVELVMNWADMSPSMYRGLCSSPYIGYWKEYADSFAVPYGSAGKLDEGLPAFNTEQPDGGFIPPPVELEELKQRALRSLLPTIKAELSVPNFIYELKDLKRSVSKVVNWIRTGAVQKLLLRLREMSSRTLSNSRTKAITAAELRRASASGYLEYSFNLMPFASDIFAIYRGISRSTKRINALIERSGKRQSRHFSFFWREFSDSEETSAAPGFWSYDYRNHTLQRCWCSRTVTYEPSLFHAQLEYNYNYTELQVANARLFALLDSLGLNLNPAIIWNAIPFSFMVDWVVRVGDTLESLSEKNMKPMINIHRSLWSVRRSRRITVTRVIDGSLSAYRRIQTDQLPTVVQTAYRRSISSLGDVNSSIQTSGLDLKEISLGVAMAVSHRRRRG